MRRTVAAVAALVVVASLVGAAGAAAAGYARPRVLLVGTWHGQAGGFRSLQAAVDAARPGDWILVAPGDYKERGDYTSHRGREAAVWITTPRLHVRGLDRNAVVIDGTRPGSARCSARPSDQVFGPGGVGRNGIVVWKADGVSIENLTACNFLSPHEGNQIWFNGGDGSGRIGLGSYAGRYLTATTTFYRPGKPTAAYGLFVSNARGPGVLEEGYASNMDDSGVYVGACRDCNTTVRFIHSQYNALGYSGTDSGGRLVVEDSEWDHNGLGISTNSQNNDDAPSPQDGRCPPGATGVLSTDRCTVFRDNDVHHNNLTDVPGFGIAGEPVGVGISIAGGRHDVVLRNRIHDNGSWGVIMVPFPDDEAPPAISHCDGGIPFAPIARCFYDDWGNEVRDNRFANNGFWGNPTNGDIADVSGTDPAGAAERNCIHGNARTDGALVVEPAASATHTTCGVPGAGASILSTLTAEIACAGNVGVLGPPCAGLAPATYPQKRAVRLRPLHRQPTMADPCAGTPANPWCARR
jgi:hypothetical protein